MMKDLMPWRTRLVTRAGDGDPFSLFQRDLGRVFDDFFGDLGRAPNGGYSPIVVNAPRTDIAETDKAIEVSAELPGMEEKDVEVTVAEGVLTIRGEKKSEREETDKDYRLAERSYGSFYRAISLPAGVDGNQAEASFKNGVLTVTVPKTAEASPKRIEIKNG